MKKRLFLVSLFQLFPCFLEATSLKPGDKAPDFTLLDEDGNEVTLSQYKGHNIALYFYPMDDTWGCVQQACSLRDGFDDLKKAGITILGISPDSVKSHKRFKSRKELPFRLLSDKGQKVAKLYGAARTFLLSWLSVKRITFLINKHGEIVDILHNIKVRNHAEQIINAFNILKHKK